MATNIGGREGEREKVEEMNQKKNQEGKELLGSR